MAEDSEQLVMIIVLSGAQVAAIIAAGWWFMRRRATAQRTLAAEPASEVPQDAPESAAVAKLPDGNADRVENHPPSAAQESISGEAAELLAHIIETRKAAPAVSASAAATRVQDETVAAAATTDVSTETIDPVTLLPNRQTFQGELTRHFQEWMRHRNPVSLLLLGVDHFEQINHDHGKAAADDVLRQIAATVRAATPEQGFVARYEQDSLGVILPEANLEAAKTSAERARSAVATATLEVGSIKLKATVSGGATSALTEDLLASFLGRADSALYAAREKGGNRSYYYAHGKCEPVVSVQLVMGQEEAPPVARPDPPPPASEDLKTDRRTRRRAAFRRKILVAPYVTGKRPATKTYFEVLCHDISATGISFLLPAPPAHAQFVVTLGTPPDVTQVIARVVRTVTIDDEGVSKHLVGCSLAGRL